MPEYNKLDKLPLADIQEQDLRKLKSLEDELNHKYGSDIYLMALEDIDSGK